jgi:hypothetical protein
LKLHHGFLLFKKFAKIYIEAGFLILAFGFYFKFPETKLPGYYQEKLINFIMAAYID